MSVILPNQTELYDLAIDEIKSRTQKITDFNEGSVIDATVGAGSVQCMELVYLLSLILKAFYIMTSTGEDLDKRLKDYNITRKLSEASTASVTLTRNTTIGTRLVSAGTTFLCSSDSTEFYNPTDIVFGIGQNTVQATLVCKTQGIIGNVLANTIDTISPSPSEPITITHPSVNNGIDQETDDQLRARFYLELSNMARGTAPALIAGALRHTGVSNAAVQKVHSGYTKLYIDSGTGTPPPDLISTVQTDIDMNWKAAGENVEVIGAETQDVDITAVLTVDPNFTITDVISTSEDALVNFFRKKQMGASVYRAELIQVLMSVSGVINVLLSSPISDIAGQASKIMRAGVINLATS